MSSGKDTRVVPHDDINTQVEYGGFPGAALLLRNWKDRWWRLVLSFNSFLASLFESGSLLHCFPFPSFITSLSISLPLVRPSVVDFPPRVRGEVRRHEAQLPVAHVWSLQMRWGGETQLQCVWVGTICKHRHFSLWTVLYLSVSQKCVHSHLHVQ